MEGHMELPTAWMLVWCPFYRWGNEAHRKHQSVIPGASEDIRWNPATVCTLPTLWSSVLVTALIWRCSPKSLTMLLHAGHLVGKIFTPNSRNWGQIWPLSFACRESLYPLMQWCSPSAPEPHVIGSCAACHLGKLFVSVLEYSFQWSFLGCMWLSGDCQS